MVVDDGDDDDDDATVETSVKKEIDVWVARFLAKTTRVSIKVHHFFSKVLHFGSLRPTPENDSEKI